ncbi:MAG: serine/threonine protein kinase [Planctomycetes bacterium]|nr:serine/threonine protein kinase [Planctomycetota bacterium]
MDERSNSQKQDMLVDKVFGGCRLIKKIGEGGMGVVYLAQHLALNKNVAVKILPPSFAIEEERVKRFVREARSAAQLEHSNIIQIYNIAKHEDFYFIVMQYADGESLARAIKREGKIKALEALDIVKEVASALSVAHRKNIIHRDIKPENIMINSNGEVKLMDFGLARVLDVASNLSRTGDILGTPYYLSPEQAQGHKVDGRADIYSLGVTLYYMLSGKKPFEGDTTLAIILKHINERPAPIRKENPEIPECVSNLINRMLEKDPDKRYQTADELVDDLNLCRDRIVAGDSNAKTITASAVSAAVPNARTGKIISWKMIGLAGGLAFVIVVLLSVLSKGKPPASPGKEPPSNTTEQISQLLKKDLAKRCNEFYKHLVNKDYAGIKPYLYVPKLTRISEDESRQAGVRLLKRRYDFYEKRGNKLVEFRIKNIKPQEPTKDTPLVNAQVELDLLFHNTKQPPKHKDDYLTIPQTHTWLMENGIWYVYILPKEQEDPTDETDDADFKKKGAFEDWARFLSLTEEQKNQAKPIIIASQTEALNVLTAPRADGTNAFSELSKLDDPALTQEDKQARIARILSLQVPGTQDTYLSKLTNIKLNMDMKLKRILSEEQFQKYKRKNLDVFDVNTK